MGQFSKYVERSTRPPSGLLRVFCLIAPIAAIVQAVMSRRLEDIVTAVWLVVLFLPSGIAPKAYYARLAALDKRPVLSMVFMFLLLSCGAFVLLTDFFDRGTSALIGVSLALVLTVAAHLLRKRRT